MRSGNKKSKIVNNDTQTSTKEKYNLVEIPLDLVIEILGRLPVKSVARFLAVCKLWETTIRSRDFITSFPFGSSSQLRTLIARFEVHQLSGIKDWRFLPLSSSSTSFFSSSSSSTCFLPRLTYQFPYVPHQEYSYHHVNGLISLGYGPKQIVCNPTTGKSITLPRVKTKRKVVKSFFGYDSVNDQYKVLCMTEKRNGDYKDPSCEHQIFTLGAPKSWKKIDCNTDHRPWMNSVCIDNVVYYGAKTGVMMSHVSLMRFNLRSECLDRVSGLPAEMRTEGFGHALDILMNYKGKVAMPIKRTSYTFEVWTMDQDSDTQEWLKTITFSTEPWKNLFYDISVLGITHTGEFILASSHYYHSDEFDVFHYNHDMNSFNSSKVTLPADNCMLRPCRFKPCYTRFYSDYVESVRLL